MGPIDSYLSALAGALRGPRRQKTDLLTEARDGLIDAAAAYASGGLDEQTAQRRAVADFGAVAVVAPEYQAELGRGQGRRTALQAGVTIALQPAIWAAYDTLFPEQGVQSRAFAVLNELAGTLGTAALLGAVLALLAGGPAVRYLGAARWPTRAIGVFAGLTCAVFALIGPLMAVLAPSAGPASLAWAGAFVVLPMLALARSARRCLLTA